MPSWNKSRNPDPRECRAFSRKGEGPPLHRHSCPAHPLLRQPSSGWRAVQEEPDSFFPDSPFLSVFCNPRFMKFLFLFLLSLCASVLPAQTIIELKPGGGVRGKTVEDYRDEQRMAEVARKISICCSTSSIFLYSVCPECTFVTVAYSLVCDNANASWSNTSSLKGIS